MMSGLELFTYCVTGMEFPLPVPCSERFRFCRLLSLGFGVRDAPCDVAGKTLASYSHTASRCVCKDRIGASDALLFLGHVARTGVCSPQIG